MFFLFNKKNIYRYIAIIIFERLIHVYGYIISCNIYNPFFNIFKRSDARLYYSEIKSIDSILYKYLILYNHCNKII